MTKRFPGIDLYSHQTGHLWHTLLGLKGNARFGSLHILSDVLVFGGLIVLSTAWKALYRAQRDGVLATTGPYACVRHPQVPCLHHHHDRLPAPVGTVPTLLMFPILVLMYVRLAHREEREVRANLGEPYEHWATAMPGFVPRLPRRSRSGDAIGPRMRHETGTPSY